MNGFLILSNERNICLRATNCFCSEKHASITREVWVETVRKKMFVCFGPKIKLNNCRASWEISLSVFLWWSPYAINLFVLNFSSLSGTSTLNLKRSNKYILKKIIFWFPQAIAHKHHEALIHSQTTTSASVSISDKWNLKDWNCVTSGRCTNDASNRETCWHSPARSNSIKDFDRSWNVLRIWALNAEIILSARLRYKKLFCSSKRRLMWSHSRLCLAIGEKQKNLSLRYQKKKIFFLQGQGREQLFRLLTGSTSFYLLQVPVALFMTE